MDIMEKPAKSPWGGDDVIGTVRIYKEVVNRNGTDETKDFYLIRLRDTAKHGPSNADFIEDNKITRESIVTTGSSANVSQGTASTPSRRPYLCYLT